MNWSAFLVPAVVCSASLAGCFRAPAPAEGSETAEPAGKPAAGSESSVAEESAKEPPAADHHMHVWSDAGRDALLRLLEVQRGKAPANLPTFDGEQAVAQLDAAGIESGVLISTAYFFGSPDIDFADERRAVRAENDWVARQAAQSPDRLVAFFGVNPLAGYAREEAERCATTPQCVGMKLHLTNSGVEFADADHVARLRQLFAAAEELGLAMIVHIRTRSEEFGGSQIDVFVDEVLPAAPGVPVQIAHLAGQSRFDASTRAAFRAFVRAFDEHPERTQNVFFDMSLVPTNIPPTMNAAQRRRYEEMNQHFAQAVRDVGLDRVVFGTDFPEAQPAPYARGLRETLSLTADELADLYDDRAPYLQRPSP